MEKVEESKSDLARDGVGATPKADQCCASGPFPTLHHNSTISDLGTRNAGYSGKCTLPPFAYLLQNLHPRFGPS